VSAFLGSVNVLRQPPAGAAGDGAAMAFHVRPHDLELARERNGKPSWPGRVVRITPLGALVRLDVKLDDGTDIRVEITRERCAELQPNVGSDFFVTPRESTVFPV
jgi:sulfate transport system ATP-binding protein